MDESSENVLVGKRFFLTYFGVWTKAGFPLASLRAAKFASGNRLYGCFKRHTIFAFDSDEF